MLLNSDDFRLFPPHTVSVAYSSLFLQPFKSVKTVLSSGAYKTGPVAC